MFRRLPMVGLILIALSASAHAAPPRPVQGRSRPARWIPGELLVLRADPGRFDLAPDGHLAGREPGLRAVLARHGLTRFAAVDPGRGNGSQVLRLLSNRSDFDPSVAARELAATGAVRAAAPNLLLDLYETVPNDFYFGGFEWFLRSGASKFGAGVSDAWDLWKGDTSTVIAVMDIGTDVGHPDLASKIWINRAEIPGNGIDDDGDGYVDDTQGWDFGNHDNDPDPGPTPDSTGFDVGFHGTFVAGLAAAATNNSQGIAGAAWNCRIMPLKINDSSGNIQFSAVAEAFQYVDMKHPAVLNMSFGTSDSTARDFFQALVNDACAANVLCVAAAGNSDTSLASWPAACNGVLSVGATDDTGARASFSSYGPWVRVAAPGTPMWSTICRNYTVDFMSQISYVLNYGWGGDPYMYGSGTSFSSPLVAGIAALVRSKNPSLTPAQVAAQIVATGDVVAFDHPIGPRVNAYRALHDPVALGVQDPTPSSIRLEGAWPNPFSASTTVAFELAASARVNLAIYGIDGRRVRLLVDAMLPAGRHAILWDGLANNGHRMPSGVYFATLQSDRFQATRKLVLTP
jgi:subtilisin family serine protease